jgi:tetratricopeptide (TPR) repeat protein
MNQHAAFPDYIHRQEEQRIRQEAAKLASGKGRSRVVLLYAPSGAGKTLLVRELARHGGGDDTIWVEPIDMDDSEYWLLSTLEQRIAGKLDPDRQFFAPYLEDLAKFPRGPRDQAHEAVLGHLRRIKRVFVECYTRFVERGPRNVVIAFDTVEAIRGTYLLLTLTQWMKALPRTLFILSSRPPPGDSDRLKNELEGPHQPQIVEVVRLAAFSRRAALDYLTKSPIASALPNRERKKLVHLTRGHPLWLALAIDYLKDVGLPEEAEHNSLAKIQQTVPYKGQLTGEALRLHEAFKRRLVTPYRETDFWHEAIKRLAVVRQSVDQRIWQRLMDDRELPQGLSWDDAWQQLLDIPWVRPRANGSHVTLHDGLAEELAERIIPLHDLDEKWRRGLWRKAVDVYTALTRSPGKQLGAQLADLDRRLQLAVGADLPPAEEAAFIEEVAKLDARKRELDQLRAARLYYQLLTDFEMGSQEFQRLFDDASRTNDVFFQELIVLEVQRFIPNGIDLASYGSVIATAIRSFHTWLQSERPDLHLEIALRTASYLIVTGQSRLALELLKKLPAAEASLEQRYRLNNRFGNACMRIPGEVWKAEDHFGRALDAARTLPSGERERRLAEGYKELGFYYRNVGLWEKADKTYQEAAGAISRALPQRISDDDREELASVYTNWAYVKALSGGYRQAQGLVETALNIRRRLGRERELGASLSVAGEIFRYDRKYLSAWQCYEDARSIFDTLGSWFWLGVIHQEEAICLFQAAQADFPLGIENPVNEAERRIIWALGLCRDYNPRYYPSALNRAGRIFGATDIQAGLDYLEQGIEQARSVADGWFLFANLIEYVELSYRSWRETGRREYLDHINEREPEIVQAIDDYDFPDLEGRWALLKAYMTVEQGLATGEEAPLVDVLPSIVEGFALIAKAYVGSHGAAAIPFEFNRLEEVIRRVPPHIRERWYAHLRGVWSDPDHGDATLLARLQELYIDLQ